MGTIKGSEVELTRDPDCKPKFCKSRPVPNKRIKIIIIIIIQELKNN